MSDDLISRNTLVERVNYLFTHTNENTPEHYAYSVVLKKIIELPTAYDKEKVIEELQKRRQWYDINENPKNPLDVSECADVREHKGKWMAYDDAIKIVKNGGLN